MLNISGISCQIRLIKEYWYKNNVFHRSKPHLQVSKQSLTYLHTFFGNPPQQWWKKINWELKIMPSLSLLSTTDSSFCTTLPLMGYYNQTIKKCTFISIRPSGKYDLNSAPLTEPEELKCILVILKAVLVLSPTRLIKV